MINPPLRTDYSAASFVWVNSLLILFNTVDPTVTISNSIKFHLYLTFFLPHLHPGEMDCAALLHGLNQFLQQKRASIFRAFVLLFALRLQFKCPLKCTRSATFHRFILFLAFVFVNIISIGFYFDFVIVVVVRFNLIIWVLYPMHKFYVAHTHTFIAVAIVLQFQLNAIWNICHDWNKILNQPSACQWGNGEREGGKEICDPLVQQQNPAHMDL